MPDLLPHICPVQLRRLEEVVVDVDDAGQVHHRAVAHIFEGAESNQDKGPDGLVGIDVNRIQPQPFQEGVHRAEFVIEQIVDERAHHHPGDEVGQKHHRLGDPLELLSRHLAEHDGAGDLQHGVHT